MSLPHPAWLRMTLDCSRIAKQITIHAEWIFCQRKESDVALFLLVTRIRKIRKICDYCPKRDGHKATSLETRNKQNGSKSTNHESQTMTFWTHASKYVFPKRSAKMIDGTEKPKIPLKFAKRAARYNEFRYKVYKMRWRRRWRKSRLKSGLAFSQPSLRLFQLIINNFVKCAGAEFLRALGLFQTLCYCRAKLARL